MKLWLFPLLGLALAASAQDKPDPCVNFFQYACGPWLNSNPIPPDRPTWGIADQLAERNLETLRAILEKASAPGATRTAADRQIGDYYAACMDEAAAEQKGAAPVKPVLDRIASLPNKLAITDELVRLNLIGVRPFFFFASEPDAKDASRMIAGLDQGGLGLPDRDYYLRTDEKSADLRKKYVDHVRRMFALSGDTDDQAAKKAEVVMRIETGLARGSLDLVSRRDPNKVYHKYTTPELISLSPGIDWVKFFDGMGVAGLASLDVSVPPFVRSVESAIVQNSLADLKTYLAWHALHDAAGRLSSAFVNENFAFYGRELTGARELRPRWKRCTALVDQQLGDALGRGFVEQTFGSEGKQKTLEMVKAIEQAMRRDLETLTWMSQATKKQALVKLSAIVNKIGYPDQWKDYSAAQVSRDDALANYYGLNQWHTRYDMAKIGKPKDKREWEMSPPTVNAYYNPQYNDINFPAGILQPPFFDATRDDATNYGSIGAVIGHELTHGFDDQGRQFDAAGNLRDWWTAADAKRFEDRASCIEKEYSSFTAIDDLKVNGKLTLGENTADNGGIRLALMALLAKPQKTIDGKTPEQRFFTGYAYFWCDKATPEYRRLVTQTDPHSPAEFRVNGVLQNMPEFQKAFACKVGDPMVSGKACRVW